MSSGARDCPLIPTAIFVVNNLQLLSCDSFRFWIRRGVFKLHISGEPDVYPQEFNARRPQKPGFFLDFSLLDTKLLETGFLDPRASAMKLSELVN